MEPQTFDPPEGWEEQTDDSDAEEDVPDEVWDRLAEESEAQTRIENGTLL